MQQPLQKYCKATEGECQARFESFSKRSKINEGLWFLLSTVGLPSNTVSTATGSSSNPLQWRGLTPRCRHVPKEVAVVVSSPQHCVFHCRVKDRLSFEPIGVFTFCWLLCCSCRYPTGPKGLDPALSLLAQDRSCGLGRETSESVWLTRVFQRVLCSLNHFS